MHSLIFILNNSQQCDRVRGHAASAMINLCNPEYCEYEEGLALHINDLLQTIVNVLTNGSLEIRIPCLVLLGCIAMTAKDAFIQFYPHLMPGMKAILFQSANAAEYVSYRNKTIECIGLVVEAVGCDTFAPDFQEIMSLINFHLVSCVIVSSWT